MKHLQRSSVLINVWVVSFAYLMILAVGFSTVLSDVHFPVGIELLLKSTSLVAFLAVVGCPVWYLFRNFRSKDLSKSMAVAAYATLAGYVLLCVVLVYVKLRTCDTNVVPYDQSWHCTVEGKGIIAIAVVIPVVSALVALGAAIFILIARVLRSKR